MTQSHSPCFQASSGGRGNGRSESHKGNKHYIGHEANEKDAALLYDKASIALAENPVLNFQENGRLNPERKRKVAACTMR